jgi:hypothetical protein
VEAVPDISTQMWMENKVHLSRVDSDRVLFIDTDTIVLKPLQHVFNDDGRDVAGRVATASQQSSWRSSAWDAVLHRYGAASFFPYLNTGLLYFQAGAHRRLTPLWLDITRDLLKEKANPFGNPGQSNQQAFSLACGALSFSFKLLSPREHAYGWMGDDYHDAHVYHTGKQWIKRVLTANHHAGVLDGNPLVSKYRLIGHLHLRRLLKRLPFIK